MRCGSTMNAPASFVSTNNIQSTHRDELSDKLHNSQLWNRNNEASATPAVLSLLRQNFIGEVPGQQQDVIRLVLQQLFRRKYAQMISRRKVTLFEAAAVDDEIKRLTPNAEVIQQRASF